MKYKVAVLDEDTMYLNRISKVFGNRYGDRIELHSYSRMEELEQRLETGRFDALLLSEEKLGDFTAPEKTQVAVLVGSADIDSVEGMQAICRYQKHEILLRQIMELCLEGELVHYTKRNVLGNTTRMYLITSPSGGCGVTCFAVGLARYLVRRKKKVLYLTFEKNPATDLFLESREEACFSDVIYLMKSKKSNMMSRVENLVQSDDYGVNFIAPCRTLFDINELSTEELHKFLTQLCTMGSYDAIIVDSPVDFGKGGYFLCDYADGILLVSGEGYSSRRKLENFCRSLRIWDEEKNTRFYDKIHLYGNRIRRCGELSVSEENPKPKAEVPDFQGAREIQVVEQIAGMELFGEFL